MGKKPVSNSVIKGEVMDLTDPKSVDRAMSEMAEQSSKEFEKIIIQEGDSPWRLITATRNNVVDRSSLTHCMSVGNGVLVKVTDLKGAGGTTVSLCYVPGKRIVKDVKDSDLWKIVDN